jgi:hypothetical protein
VATDSGEPEKKRHESPTLERAARLKELKALLVRVRDGDEGAVPRLREVLREAPELARRFVDPAIQAERSIIDSFAGGDSGLVVREALPHTLEALRVELGGRSPSPLERLLVERIVATWLQLHYFETLYAQNMDEMTIPESEFHQKRIGRAHRRHLSAVKTLAQIRKMGPAVQINIAEKQINTIGERPTR